MSFRLRVFMLVMLVAVSAIGATAWLTLRLTAGEVIRSREAQVRHQDEITETIRAYGLRHGAWPGVDRVVAGLAERTDLHIQLRTDAGEVLVDSDTLQNRPSGGVRGASLPIDPRPVLDKSIAGAANDPRAYGVIKKIVPSDIFGPAPTDPIYGGAPALAVRQVSQYRAALDTVRCHAARTKGDPGLLISTAPYLTVTQMKDDPGCLRQATTRVLTDTAWQSDVNANFYACTAKRVLLYSGQGDICLDSSFGNAVSTISAVPLQLYLGGRDDLDLGELSRPALFGLAGLLVVATLGTAWIARRVSRPVRRLTLASRQLAGGHLDVRVPTRGSDELSRLSESFNQMAEAVQRSEERQRRLIADVAHEMRTPLSNLRGYLEGLSDGVVEPSRELFVSLHEETLLQRRILDDLQVLALAEAGELGYTKAPLDLADLATTSATAHRAVAAEAGLTLTVEAPAPVWVDGDNDRLRQVLGNLLTNAIRYTDAGGQVLVHAYADGGRAVLSVHDSGVGIDSGDLHRVFDRFWRADPARQRATGGTGLGLTIAHRIVTDHGGRIEVSSRPHVGTTFTVHLPLLTGS
ncbi:HAMP domain-containing sensor histidine kinase [Paractinoplanes ferrugineus]|uniref:histidine kinase n=1 Tax=Paractinoplanes ferrugineus TaxID=113564 RepID=A0A919ME71_9ACTN|nr:ATP-binding protein [Actinoplanes ferrugineus]GIE11344.1 two-component sensor histidine kinase [Actinoplanes ferrugineus]